MSTDHVFEIEVFYVDYFVLDMWSEPTFCSKVSQKGKSSSRLLELSCEQNLDRRNNSPKINERFSRFLIHCAERDLAEPLKAGSLIIYTIICNAMSCLYAMPNGCIV